MVKCKALIWVVAAALAMGICPGFALAAQDNSLSTGSSRMLTAQDDNQSVVKDIAVTKASGLMFKVSSKSTLTTVDSQDPAVYKGTLQLSMGSQSFDKAFVGSAAMAEDAAESDLVQFIAMGEGGMFPLVVKWIEGEGDASVSVNLADGTPFIAAFHSIGENQWYERVMVLDEDEGTLFVCDAKLVRRVEKLIANLPALENVTTEDANSIEQARAVYETLSDVQKRLIDEMQIIDAEIALARAEKAAAEAALKADSENLALQVNVANAAAKLAGSIQAKAEKNEQVAKAAQQKADKEAQAAKAEAENAKKAQQVAKDAKIKAEGDKAAAEKAQKAAEDKAVAAATAQKTAEQKADAAEKKVADAQKAQKAAESKVADAQKAAASGVKANTMKVTAKTVKAKAEKKTTVKKAKAFTVKNAKGKVTFFKTSGPAKVAVSKSGKVTVKKGLKAGKTYKVKVLVCAKGNKQFAPAFKTVTLKVKVAK